MYKVHPENEESFSSVAFSAFKFTSASVSESDEPEIHLSVPLVLLTFASFN